MTFNAASISERSVWKGLGDRVGEGLGGDNVKFVKKKN